MPKVVKRFPVSSAEFTIRGHSPEILKMDFFEGSLTIWYLDDSDFDLIETDYKIVTDGDEFDNDWEWEATFTAPGQPAVHLLEGSSSYPDDEDEETDLDNDDGAVEADEEEPESVF